MGEIIRLTQQNKRGGIYMLSVILQTLFKLGALVGLNFMVLCTVFVITCVVRGDIRINIVKSKAEKEKN